MSLFWRKCQVLMWKNWVIRKRSWFLTLFEISIPVLIFMGIAWSKKAPFVQKHIVPASIERVYSEQEIYEYSFMQHDKVRLAFAPDTNFTRQIIGAINKTLIPIMNLGYTLESFDTFTSESELELYFIQHFENLSTHTNMIGYGIVIENSASDIPKNFKYKIRSTFPFWNNAMKFPQFIPPGPTDEAAAYMDKGFLALQIAIDNAYIQLAHGDTAPPSYTTSSQRLPFPEYNRDMFNEVFKGVMPLVTMLSFITIGISVVKKVVEEKVSGVTELMKMMGLQTWMIWSGWVMNGMMVYFITCSIITFSLCYEFYPDKGAVIAYVDFTIVYLMFILFCVASIFFFFAISAFFMRPTIALSATMVIWMLSYVMLQQYVGRITLSFSIYFLLSLVPLYNMATGYFIIASFETRELPLKLTNIFSGTDGFITSIGFVMIMFLLQVLVYFAITWYVTSIHPGPYGRAEPWYFIFKCKLQLFTSKREQRIKMIEFTEDDEDGQQFEAPPTDLKIGLQIHDLRKVFNGNLVAVDKVNLDIYENQITALLGHNGAGKTTTMSILTGMYSPTSGSVYTREYNIFENMDRFRNSLGLCPQHDLLFPYLTALEHLIFFGMLKGMTKSSARREGLKLLEMLKVDEKKNVLTEKLSGGMKRKVSLSIALIATPQVLVLDEPTSGMDPESRREMWDLLLKLRSERRTILITTHFMEEADVLGDRIAIMDHGKVKCYGTSLYLKRIYGTGYNLTLVKSQSSSVLPITDTIKSHVAGAVLKTTHSSQLLYTVPQQEAGNLSSMFKTLENKKSELGITSVGITCTTMEDVFLRVGQSCKEERDEIDNANNPNKDQHTHLVKNNSLEALTYKKVNGVSLIIQQYLSLLRKRSLFSIRRPVASIIFFVLPLFLIWVTITRGSIDSIEGDVDPSLDLKLSLYGETQSYVAGAARGQELYKQVVAKEGSSVTSVKGDMITFLLKKAEANIARYKMGVIAAAYFNVSSMEAVAMFNGIAYHSPPISVNLISNVKLQNNSNTADSTISTVNQPIDLKTFAGSCKRLNDLTQALTAALWLILVPIGLKGFLIDLITFPHNERTSNAKQLQLMTGVAPGTYWLACFTWDYFLYLMSVAAVMVIVTFCDTSKMFTAAVDYGVFVLVLLLFGVSGIISTYIFSFLFKSSNSAGILFTLVTLLTGTIGPAVMFVLMMMKEIGIVGFVFITPLNYVLCLEPQYALGSAILRFSYLLSKRSACNMCDDKKILEIKCADIGKETYLGFESSDSILTYVLFLAFDWIIYLLLIILIEYGYVNKMLYWLKSLWVGKDFDKLLSEDRDVRDERDRVDAARGTKDDTTVLTVDGLAKKFSRSFAAVQGVSFRVSPGECFGLLGVNGAGKTTTFRMLTGDETPTTGSAKILNYDLVKNRSKYLAQIGYCPQFDGINGFLTGEEVLHLFANLRGIPKQSMQHQIDELITLLGLTEYRNRRCGKYSGGNKRKLSTAMALIGDPLVVFLDEPTTGVDPVARRNLWDVLVQCQKGGQAIVLTSHSMEECEALCTRLTIMVNGRMKCIGSNQYLKQRYGQGYTIMVKLNPQLIDSGRLEELKTGVQQRFTFKCTLKDEHQSMLHYHLDDTSVQLSQLFSNMEELKKVHNMIEDYMVSDTTLEQVFIAFARQARSEH